MTDAAQRPAPTRRHYILACLCVVAVFNYVDRQILTILLQPIKTELQVSDTAMGLLTGLAFAVLYVTAGFPLARWSDTGVRRSIVALCLAFWSGMTVLCGVAQNYTQLALARMGVAVGEAGAVPASHSMLFDVFPPARRATVFAILQASAAAGIAFGLFFGGWLNDLFGWRTVFILVGLPGILIALLLRFTIREPLRQVDLHVAAAGKPRLFASMAHLWKIPAFRDLALIAGLGSFTGYAVLGWTPTFFVRVHGMSTSAVGLGMGIAIIVGLVAGNLVAGSLADRLSKRDTSWYLWVAGGGTICAVPFGLGYVMVENDMLAFTLFGIFKFFTTFWTPIIFTMAVSLAPAQMRAMASATITMVQNLTGIALGPVFVGALNDLLNATYGLESVRYSIFLSMAGTALAGIVCFPAARRLRRDLALARAANGFAGGH